MKEEVIQVQGLSKKFIIRHEREGNKRYTALRDVMMDKLRSVGRRKEKIQPEEEFWALKDIDFTVNQGDRVGIIGRNGAGKSTLLKVLSQITEPSSGTVRIRGRVASLLEVGTGFHPELTGRENIFLNGAILGMRRAEIKNRFDEIVSFAEVENFLDTPVKRYSSGMYVRLAFAVAAHLEPEILVVDEVLAVGDAQFQKKCLGKMQDVSKNEGRTVLFVSHNIGSIKALCNQGILLEAGRVNSAGPIAGIVTNYMRSNSGPVAKGTYKHIAGNGKLTISNIEFNDGTMSISVHSAFKIRIDYQVNEPQSFFHFFVLIHNNEGDVILSCFQKDYFVELKQNGSSITLSDINILVPGVYTISAGIYGKAMEFIDWVEKAEEFEIVNSFEDAGAFDNRYGLVTTKANWDVQ
jgi:lipopolysaccharide transport system ATP-binding protein